MTSVGGRASRVLGLRGCIVCRYVDGCSHQVEVRVHCALEMGLGRGLCSSIPTRAGRGMTRLQRAQEQICLQKS